MNSHPSAAVAPQGMSVPSRQIVNAEILAIKGWFVK
jgi:hypothetical protein